MSGKHRKNVLVRTSPKLQPAPHHRADRIIERLGADAPHIRELMHAASGVDNPFRRGGVS